MTGGNNGGDTGDCSVGGISDSGGEGGGGGKYEWRTSAPTAAQTDAPLLLSPTAFDVRDRVRPLNGKNPAIPC